MSWVSSGRYLPVVPSRRTAILISAGGQRRQGARIKASLDQADIESAFVTFGGEISDFRDRASDAAVRASGVAVDNLTAPVVGNASMPVSLWRIA